MRVLVLLALAAPSWARPGESQPGADALFERARTAQMAGRLDDAEAAYKSYLKQYKPNALVMANLGALLARREDYAGAVELYEKALKLDPTLAPVHLNLGLAYLKQSQATRAAVEFERFLRQQPKHRQATQLLGLAYLESERYEQAAELYRSLLPSSDVTIHLGLATALTRMGKLAEARRVVEPVLSEGASAEAQLAMGQILLQEGQLDEALAVLTQAERQNPSLPHLGLWIGTVYWRQDQPERAISVWRAAQKLHPDDFEVTYTLGSALSTSEATRAEGMAFLRKALALRPRNPRANYQLAKLIWQRSKTPEALPYLEQAIAADPDFREAFFLHGTILSALGRKAEAAKSLARVKELSAKDVARQQDLFTESQ